MKNNKLIEARLAQLQRDQLNNLMNADKLEKWQLPDATRTEHNIKGQIYALKWVLEYSVGFDGKRYD